MQELRKNAQDTGEGQVAMGGCLRYGIKTLDLQLCKQPSLHPSSSKLLRDFGPQRCQIKKQRLLGAAPGSPGRMPSARSRWNAAGWL